jgi:hypothetical protein
MKITLIALLFASFSSISHARVHDLADIISAESPVFGGSGCNSNTNFLDLSELKSKNLLHIKTLKLVAVRPKGMQRLSCQMVLPLRVPAGKEIVVTELQESGVLFSKSNSGVVKFSSSIFFAGTEGFTLKKDFTGLHRKDIFMASGPFKVSSGCGKSVNLRISKSVIAQNIVAAGIHQTSLLIELNDC